MLHSTKTTSRHSTRHGWRNIFSKVSPAAELIRKPAATTRMKPLRIVGLAALAAFISLQSMGCVSLNPDRRERIDRLKNGGGLTAVQFYQNPAAVQYYQNYPSLDPWGLRRPCGECGLELSLFDRLGPPKKIEWAELGIDCWGIHQSIVRLSIFPEGARGGKHCLVAIIGRKDFLVLDGIDFSPGGMLYIGANKRVNIAGGVYMEPIYRTYPASKTVDKRSIGTFKPIKNYLIASTKEGDLAVLSFDGVTGELAVLPGTELDVTAHAELSGELKKNGITSLSGSEISFENGDPNRILLKTSDGKSFSIGVQKDGGARITPVVVLKETPVP